MSLLLALAALILSTGMAPAADRPSAQPAAAAADAHPVTMEGTAYTPVTLTVKVGESVTWTNQDPFAHTVTATGNGFDSKEIPSGSSWTYRAVSKGRFPYLCALHPTMTGTLIVE